MNARLEFKLEVPSKEETLKKLSSFANTFGGFMVVGAKAKSTDGRLEDLPGVDAQDGYKQKVVQWSFDGASPPLVVEVSDPIPVPAGNGRVCYVIYTGESDVAPHFLNGRKGVYVRTDEFSARFEARMADEAELQHLFDRRKLIQERRTSLLERSRRRFDTYAGKIRKDPAGNPAELGPRLELCVTPRFPVRPLCGQGNLKPVITKSQLRWRGGPFPVSGSTVVSQHESAIVLGAAGEGSMFEANIWGALFYCTGIADAENPSKTWGIHLYGFVGHTLLFVHHSSMMLQALGYSGPVVIDTGLASMLGVPWLYGSHGGGLLTKSGSELDDDVRFSIPATSESLREKPDEIAMDVVRHVFYSVNWSSLSETLQELEGLIRRGYKYNYWPLPGGS